MKINWLEKLRHGLLTLAFCLAISALQYSVQPQRAYEIPLVYSLLIGGCTWALIDFGRHLMPSSKETGWPVGAGGGVLTLGGITLGYLLGTLLGDRWLARSSWDAPALAQWRDSLLITLLAGGCITYFFYTKNKSAYLQAKMTEAHQLASQARLKLLEAQLEPHMLFNTLANLRALIGLDPLRAQTMLDHLIAYLRATLAASRATVHPLQTEFDRLHDYLELMAVRMGPRLCYELDLPPELATQPVPTLLLQPLVENAIRHGLEPKLAGGSIHVRASLAAGWIRLEVHDSGVGLSAHRPAANGFGLAQVRERLAATYEHQFTIDLVAHNEGGTLARITFPAEKLNHATAHRTDR